VLYTLDDIFADIVYVTADGIAYIQDSLQRKRQTMFIAYLSHLPRLLKQPDIVIQDATSPDDTLIYYKALHLHQQSYLLATIIKVQHQLKFLYNFHPQQSGKVKGYRDLPKPTIIYLNPRHKARDFGL